MNKKITAALIINIFVVIATTAICTSYWFYTNNPLVESGFDSFKFFTTDSNILAAVSSLVLIPFEIQILRGRRKTLPHAAVVLKLVGMTSVMLTFTTVMTVLLPQYDPAFLLLGTATYTHVLGPLSALVTFLFLETDSKIKLPETLFALIPTALYGSVYMYNVLISHDWLDFYTFNKGGYWYISVIVIFAVTYLISFVTRLIHNKLCK